VYKTMEECRSKIESLKNIDKYFHMYISEVGKWGGLFDDETVAKLDNVDIQYREDIMNTMMREYKENKDKADLDFIERTRIMKERAKFEGTPEGQEYLASLKEEPVSVKARLDSVNFQLKDLKERTTELENIRKATEEVYNQFTDEELLEIEEKLKGPIVL
jgi:predicted nuclease with TOPRIM domain